MKKKMIRVATLALCVMLLTTNHAYVYAAEAVLSAPGEAATVETGEGFGEEAAETGTVPEQEEADTPGVADADGTDEGTGAPGGENDTPEQPGQSEEPDASSDEEAEGESVSEDEMSAPEQDAQAEEPNDETDLAAKQTIMDDAAIDSARIEAEQAFASLAASKDLMALIYLTDAYDVRAEADAESAVTAVINSGHTIYVKEVHITEEQVWYYVSFWLDGTERYGYVEEPYLAYADEDWIGWRECYLFPFYAALFAAEEDALGGNDGMASFSAAGIMPYSTAGGAEDIDAFPIAFQEKLRTLKDKHPNWIFVPVNTGLDFETAVSNEMGDKSWIQNTESNRNAGYVGASTGQGSWCYATKKAVSYYMDTQNYLDATHIFAFEQLTFNGSYHTESAVQSFLNGTFMKGNLPDENRTYANAFFTIGKDRKLSPTHLASRVYQEQGKGTSPLISGNYEGYEGYYNYFNVGASGKTDKEVIINGLKYAKSQGWNTAYKSLSGGAATIGNGYILKGQDTVYLQKFNVAPGASNTVYTHQYMQNIQAPWTEAASTQKIYSGAGSLNSAFVFKIPVYKNMPNEIKNPIKDVTLEPTSLVLRRIDTLDSSAEIGKILPDGSRNTDSFQLEAKPVPTIAGEELTDNATITWKSSDQRVAVVSADGTVTAVNEGMATITATASKASAVTKPSASCEVKVVAPVFREVIKCKVIFLNQNGNASIKTIEDMHVGDRVKEADFPDVSAMEIATGRQFMGWYTGADGSGEKFTADTAVYEKETVVYPYFAAPEEGFFVVPVGRQVYTGSAIKPAVTVYDADAYESGAESKTPLVLNRDYTVTYKNNKKVNTEDGPKPTITVKGKGNYAGSQELYFDIVPVSLGRNDIKTENVMVKYNGKKIKAAPVVMCGTKKLVKGTDYTLSYPAEDTDAYKQPGIYPVVITGKGGYTGTLTVYQIITKGVLTNKKSIGKAVVSGLSNKLYTGNPEDVKQSFEATLEKQALVMSTDGVNGDYVVVYKNIHKAGTATVELHGIGKYTGVCKKTFKIVKADLPTLLSEGKLTVVSPAESPYVKGKTTPDVTVTYTDSIGKSISLVKGVDYTVSYKNNGRLTTGEMAQEELPAIIIKGKGNFKGSITKQFSITDGQFENIFKVTVAAKDIVYKNKSGFYKTSVTVTDKNGKALKAGTDYSKEYEYVYEGTPTVLDSSGNPVSREHGEAVDSADVPQPGTRIRVRIKAAGAYVPADGHEALRETVYRIIAADIAKARVRVKTKTYLSGRPVTLTADDLTVTLNGSEMIYGRDFVIDETTYKNNIGKGTASVVIRGLESTDEEGTIIRCGGSKTVKFKIGSRRIFW